MKTLCIFDLDGTLTDSKPGIINAATYAIKSMGVTSTSYSGSLECLIGPPIRDALRIIHPFTDTEVEEAVRKFREYYIPKGMLENTMYPGIMDLLAKLQADGVAMAIATSKQETQAKYIAGHFGFDKYFDVIVGATPDGSRERKGDVITAVLDELGRDNFADIIMIGDREHDIIGAGETGLDCIGIAWGYGSVQELEAAGAKTVVHSAEELYEAICKRR